ncbi:MAG: hypothetical protein KF799_14325 [Bdellovibrionales bacterium]|nr:hypothetical protein [Bdellovibrionales bacterium]
MKTFISTVLLTLVASTAVAQNTIKPAVVNSTPAATPAATTTNGVPAAGTQTPQLPGVSPVTGQPIIYQNLAKEPKESEETSPQNNPMMQQLQQMLSSMGDGSRGDSVPANTDWNKYEYPDNFKYYYGGKGVGNIGDGLCTAKNVERSQVKLEYCNALSEVLTNEDPMSCAARELNQIINKPIGDLNKFCPTYSQLGTPFKKKMMYLQILASLITLESGWNARATEKGWYKNGKLMQGKGLFQIGTWDSSQDPDCVGIGSDAGIYDAKKNIRCGACIALKNLNKDSTIGHGSTDKDCQAGGSCGMAAYFGPMRDGQSSKRATMQATVSNWCRNTTGSSSSDIYGGAGSGGGSSGGSSGSGGGSGTRN